MYKEFEYKLQGDGANSWTVTEWETELKEVLINKYMVYFLTVQNWKLKAILNQDGLLTAVETALDNLQEPNKTNANFAWNFAPDIDSNSNTTLFIQSILGLTIDEVFSIFLRAQDFNI